MKKRFFAAMVALGTLTFVSCSQSDDSETVLSEKSELADELAKLKVSINDFNNSYLEENGAQQTRSGSDFASVIVSGAIGALVVDSSPLASEISAAGFSILAQTSLNYIPEYPDWTSGKGKAKRKAGTAIGDVDVLGKLVFENSSASAGVDSVGYYCHSVESAYKQAYPKGFSSSKLAAKSYYTDSLFACVEGLGIAITDIDMPGKLKLTVDAALSNAYDVSQTSTSADQFIANIASSYPEKAEEIEIIKQFVETLDVVEYSDLDTYDYAQQILNIINASNLTQQVKDALIAGIEVAYANNKLLNSGFFNRE